MDKSLISMDDLEGLLSPLDEEAKNTVMLAVTDTWRVPPMTRETVVGEELGDRFLKRWPSVINEESGYLDFNKIDQMMATGQVAYPMMLKKAPIISIVRSASGFTVKSADEELAKVAHANLQEILPKRIEELLTYLEYGAYYGEVTYEPVYAQDYGLPESKLPYWVIEDFNGVHPSTIIEILRDEKSKTFDGFVQQPLGYYEPIKVGTDRALIIPNNGMFGNLSGDSVLEPVYVWWFWYELVWRAFLRFLQRAGVGVVVVKAPSRGRVEIQGKSVDNMQWALQMASSLHRTNYAAVPSDMDSDSGHPLWVIDYLKMGQNEGNQFIAALELLANNIKNYLLTGDSGPAGEGAEFEVMLDTERILGHIGMYVSEYVLPKMFHWNGSSTTRASLEFQGANSRVLPLLFKLMAVAGNTAGDALQNVNWRLLFNKGGVPVLTEEEVEELKEEKKKAQEEMFQQKQQAASEKAKMQPGGEGRWAKKRDEEGQSERLEMVREALNVPLIALGPEQVAELEHLGLRAEPTITLYNPYHDEQGRFTSKERAVGTPSFSPTVEYSGKKGKYLRGEKATRLWESEKFQKWNRKYQESLEDYDFWHVDRESVGDTIDVHPTWKVFWKKGADREEAQKVFDKLGPKLNAVGKFRIIKEIWISNYWDEPNSDFYDELAEFVAGSDYPDIVEYMYLKDNRWYPTKEAARWEREDSDLIQLFNPYHDEQGRFTSKERSVETPSFVSVGGREITSKRGKGSDAFSAKGSGIAAGFGTVAAISLTASAIASQGKDIVDPKYHDALDSGAYIAKLTSVGSGAVAAGAWGVVQGRLALRHGRDFAREIRREITYKGKNKKAVFDRIGDSFSHARKTLGWGGKSILGLGGAAAAAGLLYAHLTGKTNKLAWKIEERTKAFSAISGLVGEGWTKAIYTMIFGGRGEDVRLENDADLWLTSEMLEVLPEWLMYFAYGAENSGAEFFDTMLSEDECEEMTTVIAAFLIGYMSESVELEYKLFNPYHDEYGRFTSKERSVGISGHAALIKEKQGKFADTFDKVEVFEDGDDVTALFYADDYKGAISVPGNLNGEEIAELHASVSLAQNALNEIGIKSVGQHVRFYLDPDKYRSIWKKASGQPGGTEPLAFVDFQNVAHMGIGYTNTLLLNAREGMFASANVIIHSIGTIAHELYHGRKRVGFDKRKFLPPLYEEGFAGMVRVLTRIGMSTKSRDYTLSTNEGRGLFQQMAQADSYSDYILRLYHAATAKRRQKFQHSSILVDWVRRGDWDAVKEIQKYLPPRFEGADDTTKLFNPYHDEQGKFTNKARAVQTIGKIGAASFKAGVAGIAAHIATKAVMTVKKKKGKDTAVSLKFKDKEWSLTYDQVSKGTATVANVGLGGWALAIATNLGLTYSMARDFTGRAGEYYSSGYRRAYNKSDWTYRPKPWPKGATEVQFKTMYRDLAKAFHPDRGGDTEMMQKINEAYSQKDWERIANWHRTKLEEMTDDQLVGLMAFMRIIVEIAKDNDFISFEADVDNVPIFPVEDGRVYIDAQMVNNLWNILTSIVDERKELEGDHFDPFRLNYLDGGELLLYNPYHDERGRFTVKEKAISAKDRVANWAKKNKKKLIAAGLIAGGAAAAVGGAEIWWKNLNLDRETVDIGGKLYHKVSKSGYKFKTTANEVADVFDVTKDTIGERLGEFQFDDVFICDDLGLIHEVIGDTTTPGIIAAAIYAVQKSRIIGLGGAYLSGGRKIMLLDGHKNKRTWCHEFIHSTAGSFFKDLASTFGEPGGTTWEKLSIFRKQEEGITEAISRVIYGGGRSGSNVYGDWASTYTKLAKSNARQSGKPVLDELIDLLKRTRNADIINTAGFDEEEVTWDTVWEGIKNLEEYNIAPMVQSSIHAILRGEEVEVDYLILEKYLSGKISKDGIVKLYNPYHDEKGRFTSKERAVFTTRGEFEEISHEEKDGEVTTLFTREGFTGAITTPAGITGELREELVNATSGAQVAINKMGLKRLGQHVKYHGKFSSFEDAYGHELKYDIPRAFYNKVTRVAHIAPNLTEAIVGYMQDIGKRITLADYKNAVGTIIHELYHGRFGRSISGNAIEEGLAATAKRVALAGMSTGDYLLRTREGMLEFLDEADIDGYASDIKRIARAAIYKYNTDVDQKYPYWGEYLMDWLRDGSENSKDEILRITHTVDRLVDDEWWNLFGEYDLESDWSTTKLFNPYHDVRGRFTERQHATKPLPENKFHTHGEIDKKAAFRTADAASLAYERMKQKPSDIHMYADMNEYVTAACGKSRTKSTCVKSANNSYAFYANGGIHVGPKGAKAVLKDREFGERIMAHEAYHSRKRKGGKLGPTFRTGKKYQYDNFAKRDLEEATTDMLSMRKMFGADPIYPQQAGAIALLAYQVSGRNQKKAWQIVDDLHYNINDWDHIGKLMTDFTGGEPTGGWTGSTIYAMLAELQKASANNNHIALEWLLEGGG